MKKRMAVFSVMAMFFIVLIGFARFVVAGSARLSWNPPTTNTDGSALTDLAGYKIHYGTSSGNYSTTVSGSNCLGCPAPLGTEGEGMCLPLPAGTHYFAVTAFDQSGNESGYSNEVFKTVIGHASPLGNIDTISSGSSTRVDGYDLSFLSKCFGKSIAGASCTDAYYTDWSANCDKADLNDDGKIDSSDLTFLAASFG